MIQSSIIPRATARHQLTGFGLSQQSSEPKSLHDAVARPGLYEEEEDDLAPYSTTLSSSLGLSLPNPAPTVELQANDEGTKSLRTNDGLQTENEISGIVTSPNFRGEKRPHGEIVDIDESIPRKKKYAKEAWPGRKPGPGQGLF